MRAMNFLLQTVLGECEMRKKRVLRDLILSNRRQNFLDAFYCIAALNKNAERKKARPQTGFSYRAKLAARAA
ncbi:hypothetical protein PSP6_210246 [Paraburkholderia tropica]|uniref:hypothetical protein n=1 Tax=Paraburkholderia tropica TaxID=92647 RepID=UPI001CB61AFF|nr:hypothetical protein [Paraburkholderia tropica]CAG9202775.1 hypothetical protein PSP6_210246 [Paraburkholderia tropica]